MVHTFNPSMGKTDDVCESGWSAYKTLPHKQKQNKQTNTAEDMLLKIHSWEEKTWGNGHLLLSKK